MVKDPKADLKLQYKKVLEIGLVLSLLLHIFLMQAYKRMNVQVKEREYRVEALEAEEIPLTEQQKSAPAPSRPSVPIASEDETLPEDETIEDTFINLTEDAPPPPPPPDDGDIVVFVPYDEAPEPIGGYGAIQRNLVYPEIARKAGVEGRVIIQCQIDEEGKVIRTRVLQSLGPNGCDEAAIAAIQSVKWKPAMQRDTPVRVWISVPVEFRLK